MECAWKGPSKEAHHAMLLAKAFNSKHCRARLTVFCGTTLFPTIQQWNTMDQSASVLAHDTQRPPKAQSECRIFLQSVKTTKVHCESTKPPYQDGCPFCQSVHATYSSSSHHLRTDATTSRPMPSRCEHDASLCCIQGCGRNACAAARHKA